MTLFQAQLTQSLWSGYQWKDLYLSTNDAKFGQRWWRQKWKEGQRSKRPVKGGTGVNGLNNGESDHFLFTKSFLLENYIQHVSVIFSRLSPQGVTPRKIRGGSGGGGGVRSASLSYLWPGQNYDTLLMAVAVGTVSWRALLMVLSIMMKR